MSNLFTELQKEQEKQKRLVKQQEASPSPIEKPKQQKKEASKKASKSAPVYTSTGARTRASIYTRVRKAVGNRSRLAGFTFRYQREELDRLDDLATKVNRNQSVKVSKNDLVRIALNWLLEDHEDNKRASVLSKVLARLRR